MRLSYAETNRLKGRQAVKLQDCLPGHSCPTGTVYHRSFCDVLKLRSLYTYPISIAAMGQLVVLPVMVDSLEATAMSCSVRAHGCFMFGLSVDFLLQ